MNTLIDETESCYNVMDAAKEYFLSPAQHDSKKRRVLRFIECNPFRKLNKIVEKFDLHMRFIGATKNGIGKFDLYTTETECGIKINMLPFYLPIKKQWDDPGLENHPQNWEVIGWEDI